MHKFVYLFEVRDLLDAEENQILSEITKYSYKGQSSVIDHEDFWEDYGDNPQLKEKIESLVAKLRTLIPGSFTKHGLFILHD